MTTTRWRLALVAGLVFAIATAFLAGPAAADVGTGTTASPLAGSSLDVDISVDSPVGGGEGTADCAGDPVGEHDCDKDGHLAGGPLAIEYEGFNDGNPAGGAYAFGDDFDVSVGEQAGGLNVTCRFGPDPPAGNPCPVDPTAP